mmetsp:Transcript_44803/g.118416  ORF Transcript_44803/g.118416 Transcript_44803/m.118416 type:complete len:83 (+) Transcript_44803:272-520(+)
MLPMSPSFVELLSSRSLGQLSLFSSVRANRYFCAGFHRRQLTLLSTRVLPAVRVLLDLVRHDELKSVVRSTLTSYSPSVRSR